MKDHTRKLLDKAVDSIEVAEGILDMNKPEFATGRAYYAIFYIAEALLNEKGLKFNKHSAVHAAFGEQFAKTNLPRQRNKHIFQCRLARHNIANIYVSGL
jgi:uncharacterized protein (UPF0332 family)